MGFGGMLINIIIAMLIDVKEVCLGRGAGDLARCGLYKCPCMKYLHCYK